MTLEAKQSFGELQRLCILIADDEPCVRSALRLLLEEQPGITIAGEITDSSELLGWLRGARTNVLLIDWELPGQKGQKLLPILRSLHNGLFVIVLDSRPQTRVAALSAGADGFVCKGDPPEYLLHAISCCRLGDKLAGQKDDSNEVGTPRL